jgi:hypothetical protein
VSPEEIARHRDCVRNTLASVERYTAQAKVVIAMTMISQAFLDALDALEAQNKALAEMEQRIAANEGRLARSEKVLADLLSSTAVPGTDALVELRATLTEES